MKLRLSVHPTRVETKKAGESLVSNFEVREFDFDNSFKELKHCLQNYVHSPNIWENGRVKNDNCIGLSAIPIDFDGAVSLTELEKKFADYFCVIYSSTNHTDNKPKLHVLLLLDPFNELSPAEIEALYKWCRIQKEVGVFVGADGAPFHRASKFFPHCKKEQKQPFVFKAITTGKYFSLPDLSSVVAEITSKVVKDDICPEEYEKHRPKSLRDLWESTESQERTTDLFKLALDCKRSGFDYDTAKEKLLDWISKQEKSATESYGKNGQSEEDRLEAQVLNGAYLKAHSYSPPPTKDPLPEFDKDFPIPTAKSSREEILNSIKPAASSADGKIKAYSFTSLLAKSELFVPPESLPGMQHLIRGNITGISGLSGFGKSTMLRSDAIELAKSGLVTLWITAEGEMYFQWLKAGAGESEIHKHLFIVNIDDVKGVIPSVEERLDALRQLVRQTEPDLVIIDTLFSVGDWLFSGFPESSKAAEWQRLVQSFKSLTHCLSKKETALCYLHQNNLQGSFYGSVGIRAGSDELYSMVAHQKNSCWRKLNRIKSRNGMKSFLRAFDESSMRYRTLSSEEQNAQITEREWFFLSVMKMEQPMMAKDFIGKLKLPVRTVYNYFKKWAKPVSEKSELYSIPLEDLDGVLLSIPLKTKAAIDAQLGVSENV